MFLNKWKKENINLIGEIIKGWVYTSTFALLNTVDHLLIHSTNGCQAHSTCNMWLLTQKSFPTSSPLPPSNSRDGSEHSYSQPSLQLGVAMWHHYGQWNAGGTIG